MDNFYTSYYFDLSSYKHVGLFKNIRYVWEVLSQLENYLKTYPLGHIEGDVSPQAYLVDAHLISIGKGTVVEPGAYIKGPCVIGENCTVRHGAYVRGQVITGDGCVIGHDTEMKNVIMLNKAHAAHFAYLGDSVLGNDVNLGAGTVCANLRLDRKEIVLKQNGERFPTGLRKFGAIIGDGAQLGCNSVTNPGTLIGKNAGSFPCTNFGGIVPPDRIVCTESKVIFATKNK